ncbi:MAG: hypothetical protein WBA74_04010 [Cyclobacteriaceae bacterium]
MGEEPLHIPLTFIAVVITTFGFIFYALKVASPGKKDFTPTVVSTFLIVILFITALLSYTGFLHDYEAIPPRLPVILFVETAVLISLFYFRKSREFIKKMPITTLTHIHIIRVPVEIVLWWLFKANIIDPILTFEGNNYDIIIGISAPFAGLFLVGLRSKSQFGAIVWNFAGIALLLTIVYHAIICTPYPTQQICFDIPNTIMFSFPYIWLPTFVVPIVLFCHIASIYKLFTATDLED